MESDQSWWTTWCVLAAWGWLFCCSQNTHAVSTQTIHGVQGDKPSPDQWVVPFPVAALGAHSIQRSAGSPATDSRRDYSQDYYQSVLNWGNVVRQRLQPSAQDSARLHVGRPGHLENDLRPTAYAAMVLSFLSVARPPDPLLEEGQQAVMLDQAKGVLAYLCNSHQANGGACDNGKAWGGQWQSAAWARSVGMAAWQIWEELDEPLRRQVVAIVQFEADRFIDMPPKSGLNDDTGAEENAWNASITSLACNMMPEHPRASQWKRSAQRYLYNTFSVQADRQDQSLGDDQIPVSQWVTTLNAHDDFTVENHGIVHVGYLKNSLAMQLENAIHWQLTARTIPMACRHHALQVFRVLGHCTDQQGAAIYFSGNDWHIYLTQCSDILIACQLAVLEGSQEAAYLESVSLPVLLRRQNSEGGFYNGRRDLEYGGLCASRLIACYYLHRLQQLQSLEDYREAGRAEQNDADASDPSQDQLADSEAFDRWANGIQYLQHARAITHRTSEKFASFTWAQKRMALAIPLSESAVVWPHFDSYLGIVNGQHSSAADCQLKNFRLHRTEDSFYCLGTLVRCQGQLEQDFYFGSPPQAMTIYIERLRPSADFKLQYRKTGLIGLDYDVEVGQRQLLGDFGTYVTKEKGGRKQAVPLTSRWLNIDNRVGYLMRRSDTASNQVLYHDKETMPARKPHMQESIALVSDQGPETWKSHWSCIVTVLNQEANETRTLEQQLQFQTESGSEKVKLILGDLHWDIDFGELQKPANAMTDQGDQ